MIKSPRAIYEVNVQQRLYPQISRVRFCASKAQVDEVV